MDADAEAHLLAGSSARVLIGNCLLDGNGALDRVDRTGKIRHYAVAGGIEDAPVMGGDQPVENRPVSLQPPQGADFVKTHQPAILGDVGREDYRELAFDDLVVCHRALLKGAHAEAERFDKLIYNIDPRSLPYLPLRRYAPSRTQGPLAAVAGPWAVSQKFWVSASVACRKRHHFSARAW